MGAAQWMHMTSLYGSFADSATCDFTSHQLSFSKRQLSVNQVDEEVVLQSSGIYS